MILVLILFMLSACTVSLNFINSSGKAEDVVDEEQVPENDISPELSVPTI